MTNAADLAALSEVTAPRGPSMGRRRFTAGNLAGFATPVVALALWQIVAQTMHNVYVPTVSQVVVTFVHQWFSATFQQEAVPSLYRLTLGYFFACLVGITLGVLIGSYRRVYLLLDPVLQFLRATPPTVMIPIGILLIGIGDEMKIIVIAFGAMWPILLNAADGARLVPFERLDTARIFGLSRPATLARVILPSAASMIAAGMRTGLSISLVLIVVSEMIGSTNGIGYYILQAQRTFAIPEMYGGIMLLAILGYVLNTGFVQIEQRVLAWHYRASEHAT